MTNREKMIQYCKNFKSDSVDSLMTKDDILIGLTENNREDYLLCGCPNAWGLFDFEGNCDEFPDDSKPQEWEEIRKICLGCWQKALSE